MRRYSVLDVQVKAKQAVLAELKRREMGPGSFGDLLGMSQPGVNILLDQEYWSLDTAVTAAICLGMDVSLILRPPKTKLFKVNATSA